LVLVLYDDIKMYFSGSGSRGHWKGFINKWIKNIIILVFFFSYEATGNSAKVSFFIFT
jgi:hypothetical protein